MCFSSRHLCVQCGPSCHLSLDASLYLTLLLSTSLLKWASWHPAMRIALQQRGRACIGRQVAVPRNGKEFPEGVSGALPRESAPSEKNLHWPLVSVSMKLKVRIRQQDLPQPCGLRTHTPASCPDTQTLKLPAARVAPSCATIHTICSQPGHTCPFPLSSCKCLSKRHPSQRLQWCKFCLLVFGGLSTMLYNTR